ncbi:MAG TPA: hypothetical protein VM577_05340 [Anaerovoracaceae bacterium]|nr:hypothetical protein [Anaerovoracaceae bacterium]
MNKLSDQYAADLFDLVAEAQSVAASLNKFPYSKENSYLTGVEIAAIGIVAFVRGKSKTNLVSDEEMVKDILAKAEEWDKKLDAAEAAHAAGTCGCGASHGKVEDEPSTN